MTSTQEILAALHSGQDHRALMAMVQRHHAQGLSDEEPHGLFQQIFG